MNVIEFPRLGLRFDIDPVLIHYKNGGGVHWYGIIIAVGVLLALLLCSKIYKSRGRDPEELLDFLLWALPAGIVGARAYYVIFSGNEYKSFWDVIAVWEGGLAIYGGILAGIATAVIYCRIKGLNFLDFADVCVPGVAIAQALGRWGNFVNGEAHGGPTDLPWGMCINGSEPVHPTFLYESLWSLMGMFLLLFLISRCLPSGVCFFSYFLWYGTGRFFIEGLRTDSLYLTGGIRVSQLVAVITAAVGIAGIIWVCVVKKLKKYDKC